MREYNNNEEATNKFLFTIMQEMFMVIANFGQQLKEIIVLLFTEELVMNLI